ncbi:MAG: helicase RepA family protein, partial [Bacteroidales bacterium]|nr:helicase RepA family protein [Bacteroidales bacterium]
PPALIEGILQYGHKMLIVGPSKAGKSFFAIELGLCISKGKPFLGFPTAEGKVLYLNMEISEESFEERVWCVAERLGCLGNENFCALSLRGAVKPVDGLVSDIIRDYKDCGFSCVILDPVYKIIPGDENSAEAMKKLTDQLDRLCVAMRCCAIYVHHHSKGAQGGKAALDRASGSGVLTRDADEVFDLTDVEVPEEVIRAAGLPPETTVWDLDITSRDYGRQLTRKIYFSYPLHELDEKHFFDGYFARGSAQSEGKKLREIKDFGKGTREKRREENEAEICAALDAMGRDAAPISELARALAGDPNSDDFILTFNAKKSMIYRTCKSSERFSVEVGIVKIRK